MEDQVGASVTKRLASGVSAVDPLREGASTVEILWTGKGQCAKGALTS